MASGSSASTTARRWWRRRTGSTGSRSARSPSTVVRPTPRASGARPRATSRWVWPRARRSPATTARPAYRPRPICATGRPSRPSSGSRSGAWPSSATRSYWTGPSPVLIPRASRHAAPLDRRRPDLVADERLASHDDRVRRSGHRGCRRWRVGGPPHPVTPGRWPLERRDGRELGIARKTVETHLARLYERYGCRSRAELAVRTERDGWLDLPPG